VGERLRTTAARHPGRALGVLAAVAVLGSALAAGWTDRLALSTESEEGALRVQVRGGLTVRAPVFRVAVQTMRAQLSTNSAVATVQERKPNTDARSTVLVVRFNVSGSRRDTAIARIERNLDPGPLTLSFKGSTSAVRAAKDDVLEDLVLLLLALPLVALIAAGTLGIRPAGAALLAAGASSAVAAIACELLGGAFDTSWLGLVGAAAGGTLLSLQLCAMARTGSTPAVIWGAGLAAAATFGAAAVLGVDYLGSLGLGGALGSLLAAPASLIAMGTADGFDPAGDRNRAAAPWRGIATLLAWSRLMAAVIGLLALALLLILVAPVDRLAPAALGAATTPPIDDIELGGAICAAALVTAILGGALGRRAGLAIVATIVFAFPATAIAGLLVVSFQRGWLDGALDYTSNDAVQLGSLVGAVSIVAAVCAAQAVALLAAARQADDRTGAERVAEAMARCGPAATLVCLAGAAAGAALGFSSRSFMQEFGLGTAAGLLLELLIVQLLLAPALLRFTRDRSSRQ
jgi:hypothetical protein